MDLLQPSAMSDVTAEVAMQDSAGDSVASPAASTPDSDGALMVRYAHGDMRAFEILYARHKGGLYRYLQRLCRQSDAVNDLFQEVWSKVIASRNRYEVRAQFTTFLFQIAHNCAIDHFRRIERRRDNRTDDVIDLQDFLPGADAERPDARASEAQLQAAFERALEHLPAEQRNVFVLREETGLSLEEIGRVTGVNAETAKSRLRYALTKLRAALKQYQPRNAVE
jgi:RNA polymerase sigma-70 factor, ECF subfamily